MAEYVKKTAFGYKVVPGGQSDQECSHVILTKQDYEEILKKKNQAERDVTDTKERAAAAIRKVQKEANRQIQKIKDEYDEEINGMLHEVEHANEERDYQIGLNQNLLRINKERANAVRNLRPKKDHTGYVVISSQEKEVRYKSGKNMLSATVWETVLQSPYSIEFSEDQARKQIHGELLTNDGGWKMGAIGIISTYMGEFDELIEEKGKDIYNQNTAFAKRLRANYKAGYWEYIVLHTLPLRQVPKDMLP